jgi:hypothetical protein
MASIAVLMGCGRGAPSDPAHDLTGLTAELVITRQRDLLDRGLINVLTRNESGEDLLLADRRLVADHFETVASAGSTSLRDGRTIAIQVPYGHTVDCTDDTAVSARFAFTYRADGGSPATASVDVTGTEILDAIRAEQCATRVFEAAVDASLTDPVITAEGELVATLRLEPTRQAADGAPTLTIVRASGTILVAARLPDDLVPLAVPAEGELTVPVTFTVNRCDPHALAEVTKRYGLDLDVSSDGAPPQSIAIDVSSMEDELERIVQRCRDRAG